MKALNINASNEFGLIFNPPMLFNQTLTYISLFSGAGVGRYGLLEEGFECVATNKILDSILKPLNKN
ncbi:adenine/cytosine DNA methyltransferase [Helicobacter pylori Shi417]|uniref:Adenine/cytosine DNA methyltransferase n=1 Tax=Helicobacter pylori Shi169 TaxID=1163741 RepID=A0A0E0W923_HELPX|nr:adenine/cytosine DNA methyltransferase [Helicobacter pylori Shi417]AFH98767.1 adenine/cytosine DNA methyltransferase [Helicobacter pylori Shi169]